jgi:hypothetical protein
MDALERPPPPETGPSAVDNFRTDGQVSAMLVE